MTGVHGFPYRAHNNSWIARSFQTIVPGDSSANVPLSHLPRIAWHGGPLYFSTLSHTQILESITTYPFFEFYLNITSDNDAIAEKSFGINGGVNVTSPTDLSLIRSAGLYVFTQNGEYSGTLGSEHIGWTINDEIDMFQGPGWNSSGGGSGGAQGFYTQRATGATLPVDSKPRFANYGKGVMYWENDDDAASFENGGNNIGNWLQHIPCADLYWYAGVQSLASDGLAYLGRSPNQIARCQNYGWMIERHRSLQSVGSYNTGPKPIYGFVETGHPYSDGNFILPEQFNGACWNMIIHGAAGIVLFVHDFTQSSPTNWSAVAQYSIGDNVTYAGHQYCATYNVPNNGVSPTSDTAWLMVIDGSSGLRSNVMTTGMAAQIPQTSAAIQALAWVINTQTLRWIFNTELETMLKAPADGYMYIFAQQNINHTSGTYIFVLPSGVTGASASVLNESRSIPINGNQFSDSFAAEYVCHIYKVAI